MVGAAANDAPRTVSILGATGSIGTSTLSVLEAAPGRFTVDTVTARDNSAALARIAVETGARCAVVADPDAYADLKERLAGTGIEVAAGPDAVTAAAGRPVDITIAAIVGAAGLAPSHAALAAGGTLALATKECMVSAGDLFVATAREVGARLLPVDSEHNAIFQLMEGRDPAEIARIILTASGGPLRRLGLAEMADVTPEIALNHPRWSMGAKISIDSATMMNKGLEMIEAFHLFPVGREQLDVIVHPQSIVHGMIELVDGSQLAALGPTDMRLPIAHCLTWPERSIAPPERLDLASIGALTFEPLDRERFPAFDLAMQALDAGGWATNILNAANELAVAAFLEKAIAFPDIAAIVADVLDTASAGQGLRAPASVEEAMDIDSQGRRLARDHILRRASRRASNG